MTANTTIHAVAERTVFRQLFSCCNYEKCPWLCSCLEPAIVLGLCVTGVWSSKCPPPSVLSVPGAPLPLVNHESALEHWVLSSELSLIRWTIEQMSYSLRKKSSWLSHWKWVTDLQYRSPLSPVKNITWKIPGINKQSCLKLYAILSNVMKSHIISFWATLDVTCPSVPSIRPIWYLIYELCFVTDTMYVYRGKRKACIGFGAILVSGIHWEYWDGLPASDKGLSGWKAAEQTGWQEEVEFFIVREALEGCVLIMEKIEGLAQEDTRNFYFILFY